MGEHLWRHRAESRGIRRFGAASLDLAWVAAGRYDGFWESNLQPWDTAAGCLLVGSRTPPVEEVIEDGVNGHLVDFFDAPALAQRLAGILADPQAHAGLRTAARETIRARYELADCRDRLVTLIRGL